MSSMAWEPVKQFDCERIGESVTLECKLVYPAEHLPDQPPRVLARRCSMSIECNAIDKPACVWAGTLPDYDPFR
jgi:hypothetical protein